MIPRQRAAIAAPAFRAADVGYIKREIVAWKGSRWSTLLSVNR